MKLKQVVTVVLLAFLAVSAVVGLRGGRSSEGDPNDQGTAQTVEIDSGVVVYYFHRTARCMTCNSIEAYTRQVMDSAFAEPQAEGSMQLVSVNYETAANEHFVKDFELTSNSVVLVRLEAGEITDWKNLDRIWDLVKDPVAFSMYIQQETQTFVSGAS